MPKYAWGTAVKDFAGFPDLIVATPQPRDNKLLADGVEVMDVDYVDTDNNEYRVLLRDGDGKWKIDHETREVMREVRKAKKLEWTPADHLMEKS